MGFTGIWLPPAYKGAAGVFDVGYGVYDTYDLGEFDQKGTVPTKYGTKDEYLRAVAQLQKYGIQVLADIVLDHKMGADAAEWVNARAVDPGNRNRVISDDEKIEAYTYFSFPGRSGRYSPFIWNSSCFDGVDWDESRRDKDIFEFDGKSWNTGVSSEDGNFDYLMGADIDFSCPWVREELYRWGEWYYDTVHPDGFRLDALKHIEDDYFEGWLCGLRQHSGKELFTVGEYWSTDVNELQRYLDSVHSCMSLFDVPLHMNFYNCSNSSGRFDMRKIFDGTLVNSRSMNAVTFVGNHDTQPGQALQSWVGGWFRPIAYALILLRQQGYPCVFYGDIYGIPHDGIDPVGGMLIKMVQIRKTRAYGVQHDYFDDPDIIGWTREGDEEIKDSGLACVVSDGPGGSKKMFAGTRNAGKTFTGVYGGGTVVIDENGTGVFSCPGGSVEIYII
jgi:alpha-amylase